MSKGSDAKGWGYRLRFRLGELVLQGVVRWLPRVPVAWLETIGEVVWRVGYRLQRKRVRRMEGNVALALGDDLPDPDARRALVRRSCRHAFRSVLEAGLAVTHEAERARLWSLPIEGRERLAAAFERGRGVLVVSAHIGAFTALPIRLAADYPVSLVANRPADDRVATLLDEARASLGMGSVPVRPAHAAARASLTALREGRVLTILADEFKSGGVEIEFFGRPASAPRGPVTLAMRSGAALVPVFARRDEHDRLSLHVGREIELTATDDPVKDVVTHTQRIFDEIERQVRAHPDQWSWANFRARQRPAAPKFRAMPAPSADENAEAAARR